MPLICQQLLLFVYLGVESLYIRLWLGRGNLVTSVREHYFQHRQKTFFVSFLAKWLSFIHIETPLSLGPYCEVPL